MTEIEARLAEAIRLRRDGRAEDAAGLCAAVLAEAPGHAGALRQLGLADIARGEVVAGLDHLVEGVRRDPDPAAGLDELNAAIVQAFNAAVPLHRAFRLDGAEAIYRAILRLVPGHGPTLKNLEHIGRIRQQPGPEEVLTVGITTFGKRFEPFFKPLLTAVKTFAPRIEVVVTINGEHGQSFDEAYRREVLAFCAGFPGTFPVVFPEFRGLTKMWNTILTNASKNFVLLLNDDVTISDRAFFDWAANVVLEHNTTVTVNGSWSHVIIKRDEIDELGYFDERLIGIGEEDTDMEYRYSRRYGHGVSRADCPHVVNHLSEVRQDNIRQGVRHYSAFNREFLTKVKYDVGATFEDRLKDPSLPLYPYETFYRKNRDRL